jgi:tricorn protease
MSKRAAVLALGLAAIAATESQAQTRLLRTPTVSARQIAFAYANNIWTVDRAGGNARRITSFQGQTTNPKFSPDGSLIAFSAEYGGNTDVYVVSPEGGQPKRLTWHPGGDQVQGWTPDGKSIVFASTRASLAPSGAARFWTVPVEGGVEQEMALPRAYQGKISPDGRKVAFRMNSSWDEERRNYRGGQNKPIWIVDLKTFELETPPRGMGDPVVMQAGGPRGEKSVAAFKDADSKDMDPVWVGDAVYFVSDRDGVANVWAYEGKKLRQVTKFTDFDVKALDANGGSVVFEQAGYVHLLDPKSGAAHVVNIKAEGDFPWMMPQWKDVSARMTNIALSATGKRAAVEARGEIFTIPAEKGDVRNMTRTSGSAEIAPAWSPDGKSLSYFSDKSGEYRLYIAAQDGLTPPREIVLPEPSRYFQPAWSPNGQKISFQDTHYRLWLVDVATGSAKVADGDKYYEPDRSIAPAWSPDSRWLAYSKQLPSHYRAVFAYNVETGETKQVTDGMADATSPAWDASGRYLWFFASTNYGLNSSLLDMSAYDKPQTKALYLTILSKADSSPILPESDEESARTPGQGGGRGRGGNAQADSAGEVPATRNPQPAARAVTIDFDGIQKRIIAIPGVPERDYSSLRPGPSGTVFFIEPGAAGGGGGGRGGAGGGGSTIVRYQLSTRRAAPFVQGAAQFVVSADASKLLYRTGGANGGLFLVDANRPAAPQAGTGRMNAELRAFIDPREEFKQIFNEGWRNQRNNFYVPNLHGTDWPKMRDMYAALLPFVNHRADLNYLIDNMGAETSIGHSYVRGGEMPEVPNANGGLLGADFTIDAGRYKITKIYETEIWNPELRAPLAQPGQNIKVGDYVVAINGEELKAPDNMYRLLDGTANRQTVIAVNSQPSLAGARNVTVVPVASEQGLRTRAWVENNRRYVDSASNGQLAYVHLPNTGQPGYTSFNRYYFAQQDRKGAVIDERYNGGGSAADYIVDLLQRDYDGYFNNPAGNRVPFTSPVNGIWGPKVMIINEMAGSGGDLMPYMFRYRKIGPLVGTRTWGGLVATSDTPPFVDGGSMIAPRFGFFSRDNQWAVENEGVAPDIYVENTPKEVIAGHDPQLERAVQEAMRLLKETKNLPATTEPPFPMWGKRVKPPTQ